MKKSNTLWIILLCILAMLGLFFLLFERKEVPDIEWEEKYSYSSKNPDGLWAFQQILRDTYGDSNVIVDPFYSPEMNSLDTSTCFVIGPNIRIETDQAALIENVIKAGSSIVFIGDNISFQGLKIGIFQNYKPLKHGMVQLLINKSGLQDSIFLYKHYFEKLDTVSGLIFKGINYNINSDGTSEVSQSILINSLDTSNVSVDPFTTAKDSTMIISCRFKIGKGNIIFHILPDLFFNKSILQPFYPHHLDVILNYIQGKKIVLSHSTSESLQAQSPLGMILKSIYLKTSYYVLLLAILIFILLGLFRKQKAIPLHQRPQNTTMQYLKTLSKLYHLQDQPYYLVLKMKDNFMRTVFAKYQLRPQDMGFADLLAKKSKAQDHLINSILNDFSQIEKQKGCNEYTLASLNTKLENFYRISNTK